MEHFFSEGKIKVFSDNKNLITMVLIFLSICKVYFKKFP